ncbi:MAG: hypothetical protein AABX34_03185 [Nanoarchaeota archaeon]
MVTKFKKFVSKGSRFNQIYVPKNMERLIDVGDEVEVTLIKKHAGLHYSKGLKKLSKFKENLIKDVFSFLNNIESINYIFVVGSFLTEKISYNDIDIVLVTDKISNSLNEEVYGRLIEEFNLKFHLLAIEENRFNHLLKICPLTKSMFSKFICNRTVKIPDEKLIDKNHIKFLLMMPRDLLEIRLNSRAFFDSLRRLITIERFLKNNNLDMEEINIEIKESVNNLLYNKIKNNEEIEEKSIGILRKMIKSKLKIINSLIENG